jgi:hypothetical protein
MESNQPESPWHLQKDLKEFLHMAGPQVKEQTKLV